MAEDERIAKLAKHIGSEVRKEQHLLLTEGEVLELRRHAATELYSICADFAASVNRLLTPPVLALGLPPMLPPTALALVPATPSSCLLPVRPPWTQPEASSAPTNRACLTETNFMNDPFCVEIRELIATVGMDEAHARKHGRVRSRRLTHVGISGQLINQRRSPAARKRRAHENVCPRLSSSVSGMTSLHPDGLSHIFLTMNGHTG